MATTVQHRLAFECGWSVCYVSIRSTHQRCDDDDNNIETTHHTTRCSLSYAMKRSTWVVRRGRCVMWIYLLCAVLRCAVWLSGISWNRAILFWLFKLNTKTTTATTTAYYKKNVDGHRTRDETETNVFIQIITRPQTESVVLLDFCCCFSFSHLFFFFFFRLLFFIALSLTEWKKEYACARVSVCLFRCDYGESEFNKVDLFNSIILLLIY